jgi:hypothetical protein
VNEGLAVTMRGLPFPANAQASREPSYPYADYASVSPVPNIDDIPIDPALGGPAIDVSQRGVERGVESGVQVSLGASGTLAKVARDMAKKKRLTHICTFHLANVARLLWCLEPAILSTTARAPAILTRSSRGSFCSATTLLPITPRSGTRSSSITSEACKEKEEATKGRGVWILSGKRRKE